jgi:hypothetical protein
MRRMDALMWPPTFLNGTGLAASIPDARCPPPDVRIPALSIRSILLGLLLGLAISVATYFNDAVIHQTKLIGNFFPVAVFGVLVVVLLLINPLLGALRLRGTEMAVIAAIGLAACGWPGSGFFRTFNTSVAMPSYLIRNNASWQAARVMSYVPGGAAELGEGHVSDWTGFAQTLVAGSRADGEAGGAGRAGAAGGAGGANGAATQGDRGPARLVWEALPTDVHRILEAAVQRGRLDPIERQRLLFTVNNLVTSPDFWQHPEMRQAIDPARKAELLDERERTRQQQHTWRKALTAYQSQLQTARNEIAPQRVPLEQRREVAEARRRELESQRLDLLDGRDALERRMESLSAERREAAGQPPPGVDVGEHERQLAELDKQLHVLRGQLQELRAQEAEFSVELRQVRRALNRVGRELMSIDRPVNALLNEVRLAELKLEQLEEREQAVNRRLNRAALVGAFASHLAPMPPGGGWLLGIGGEADPLAVGVMQQGWELRQGLRPWQLPWESWAPVLTLWVPIALLVGVAAVCLALVVHPQWAERELLPYPIARFVQELVQTSEGRRFPDVAYSKLFWLGAGGVLAIHVVNGLFAWELTFVRVLLDYNFLPMRTLFPNASQAPQSWAVFLPTIYFAVIGFAFFLRTEVSLSLGLVGVAYMLLGSVLYGYGVAVDHDWLKPGNHSLILFGAWLGAALMILYTGRWYYLNVAGSVIGLPRSKDVPPYAVWAARGLVLCLFVAVYLLTRGGLDWILSLIVVAMVMMLFLVLTRISTETGAFFIQPGWLPVGVLAALMGEQALGPTAYFLIAITSVVLAVDPREALMPFVANALRIGQQAGIAPRRSAGVLIAMVVLAFGAALLTTMLFQYNRGVDAADLWAVSNVPSMAPGNTTNLISELSAREELTTATQLSGLERLGAIRPQPGALSWVATGMVLVLLCAWARLRFAWWPLHPVIFMVFGSVAAMRFAASFFIGWAIKSAVVRLGGTRSYHTVQPLMIGLIAGEIVAVLVWTVIGAVYFQMTGTAPVRYDIFPP